MVLCPTPTWLAFWVWEREVFQQLIQQAAAVQDVIMEALIKAKDLGFRQI